MSLAIVIPAFKGRFLRSALRSLALQVDKAFTVYIGDDESPDDLRGLCDEFQEQLQLVYHRFPTNLGTTSLARHWNRCVALSREEWVWLFSDDDLADPQCVAAFRSAVLEDRQRFDLYRFPVGIIDKNDRLLFSLSVYDELQSSLDFALRRLRNMQLSFAADKVFSRRAFEREGGFVEFPYGWCSDDASWIAFARETGSRQVSRGGVYWRWSDANLSSRVAPIEREKILAALLFLEWLTNEMERSSTPDPRQRLIKHNYERWFYHQLYTLSPRLRVREVLNYSARLARTSGSSRLLTLFRFVRSGLRIRLTTRA